MRTLRRMRDNRGTALSAMLALVLGVALAGFSPTTASAVTYNMANAPANTVTADPLPTVQIDSGVVWSTVISGNTVFAGGQFTNVRPAGAAPGTQLTPRNNLLAFDLTTGELIASWNVNVKGIVRSLAMSPDGNTLYIGGNLSAVNGVSRVAAAAVDAKTGALLPFRPVVNTTVNAIVATNSAVYLGGEFTQVNYTPRSYLAAVNPSTGALTSWAPTANYVVKSLAVASNGRIIAAGSFQTINGAMSPGVASLDASTGTLYPFAVNSVIQDYGTGAATTSVRAYGDKILGATYRLGTGTGNYEGFWVADAATGNIVYLGDCHGDNYGIAAMNDVVYDVSHHHDCRNISGQPDYEPRRYQHADAWSINATGKVLPSQDPARPGFPGQPAPTQYDWLPTLDEGTFTGMAQAAWSVAAGNGYVVLGGEFPRVNLKVQQGLVRFATRDIAPKKAGPVVYGNLMQPSVYVNGTNATVTWPANWDRDQQTLTYDVLRSDKGLTPISTMTATTQWWNRPTLSFADSGLTAGTSYTYHIRVTDRDGNSVTSSPTTITAGGTTAGASAAMYSSTVLGDNASHYWKLNEAAGATTLVDSTGKSSLTPLAGLTLGAASHFTGVTAATVNGTTTARAAAAGVETAPNSFTVESWFKTSTTTGGRIVGFGNATTGTSAVSDRQVYLDNSGKLVFGVRASSGKVTISSGKSYNDNAWHQVSAMVGPTGMQLYVDGSLVASNANITMIPAYQGYWRVGGDSLTGWPSAPTSQDLAGSVADVAVYVVPLDAATVAKHWTVATGTAPVASTATTSTSTTTATSTSTSTAPAVTGTNIGGAGTAANLLAAVKADGATRYWKLNDATGATTLADSVGTAPMTPLSGVKLGASGHLDSGTVTSASLDGTTNARANSSVKETALATNLTVEAWVNTKSTTGGRIMGFSNATTGTSVAADRMLYLDPAGKAYFGIKTTTSQVAASTVAVNDGKWHHLVGTLSSTGMVLYIDGKQAATNTTVTSAPIYSGYWRLGGDKVKTWPGAPTSEDLVASVADVAVYKTALSAAQIANHFSVATAGATTTAAATATTTTTGANVAPTAAITVTGSGSTLTFGGAGSTDSDGTIAGCAWNFGDGSTDSGVSVEHTFAAAGTYTVTLTVTDNKGATGKTTKSVTVSANKAPVAAFTSSTSGLTATLNGSGSSDPDGRVASYGWNFGDGSTGTGATISHTYKAAGTYSVVLTVTDNVGATNSLTKSVTVTSTGTTTTTNVAPTAAFTLTTSGRTVSVDASGSKDSDGTISAYGWNFGDAATANGVKASHTYAAAGTFTITLAVKDNSGAVTLLKKTVTVA